jgi:hypothetical protein
MNEKMAFVQPRDSGRLIVAAGQVSVIIETDFLPQAVIAGFVDHDVVKNFPTCVPSVNDSVQAEIFTSPNGLKFGVIVTWNVTGHNREIEWLAL